MERNTVYKERPLRNTDPAKRDKVDETSRDLAALTLDVDAVKSNAKPLPPVPTDTFQRTGNVESQWGANAAASDLTSSFSQPPCTPHLTGPHREVQRPDKSKSITTVTPDNILPRRSASARKPVPVRSGSRTSLTLGQNRRTKSTVTTATTPPRKQTETSPKIPPSNIGDGSPTQTDGSGSSERCFHPRLPDDFNPTNSVNTSVETILKPEATRETVNHQISHVEHKVIHRDIHVDHYFHYTQPVKVVEIVPATHYRLDPVTREKVEIPAPRGWKMPANLQPTNQEASNYGAFEQTARHYLVDKENPTGKLEESSANTPGDMPSGQTEDWPDGIQKGNARPSRTRHVDGDE